MINPRLDWSKKKFKSFFM